MTFSVFSYIFVTVGSWGLNWFASLAKLGQRWQIWILLLFSYLYYYLLDGWFLLLIWFTTVAHFGLAKLINKEELLQRRRAFLWVAILASVGLLAYFKYGVGVGDLAAGELILPLGISFYTFQVISYTVDVYRRQIEPENDLANFALFVAFFPQLLAGPIMRAKELLPQLKKRIEFTLDNCRVGVTRIIWGLAKKLVIADHIAFMIHVPLNHLEVHSPTLILLVVLAFLVQLYCDFSGYCDIAIGTGRLFGIKIPENFDYPYFARNISDFWRRWHMTLTRWVMDYIYLPLYFHLRSLSFFKSFPARARISSVFVIAAMVSMLLLGMWHGSGWNFVLFGFWNGLAVIFYYSVKKYWDRMPVCLQVVLTFGQVFIGGVFFLMRPIDKLGVLVSRLGDWQAYGFSQITDWTSYFRVCWIVVGFFIVHYLFYRFKLYDRVIRKLDGVAWMGYVVVMSLVITFWSAIQAPLFIYFQF